MRRGRKLNPRHVFYIRYVMDDGTVGWIRSDIFGFKPICLYNIQDIVPPNDDQITLDLNSDISLNFDDDRNPNNIKVGPIKQQANKKDQDDDILNGNHIDEILGGNQNQEQEILNGNQDEEKLDGNQNQDQEILNENQDQVENHEVRIDNNNGSSDRRNENTFNRRRESSDEEEEKFEESQFGKKIFFDNVRKVVPNYKLDDDDCDISLLDYCDNMS